MDSEMVLALNHLSTFYDENTLANRLNLRGQLEGQCFEVHKQFLTEYSKLQEKLDLVEKDVDKMRESCDEMQMRLNDTLSSSGALIKRADNIFQSSKNNTVQKEVVTAFLQHFQLTEKQIEALKVTSITSSEFFDALREAHRIHLECQLLLQTSHQHAGLEIMESMQEYMESAYKLLYRWMKNECRILDTDSGDAGPLLVQGFGALQERPVLLSYCLQQVGDTRNKVVKRAFIKALTQGGPNGHPRPIEIHAHDHYRYVSDMAAWIHQALASETELISALLAKTQLLSKEKKKYSPQTLQILNTSLCDVCVPFKARVVQVLSLKPDVRLLSQISDILDFYHSHFVEQLGETAALSKTFEECRSDTQKVLLALEKKANEKLEGKTQRKESEQT